jgi:hypothetical protein
MNRGSVPGRSKRFFFSTASRPVLRFTQALMEKRGKSIPVTGGGSPYSCETWKLPHFLDNRLTDGGEDISVTHRPAALYTQEDS